MAKAPHKRTTVRIGGDVTGPFVVGDENTVTAQHDRSATDTPVAPHPVHRPAAGRRPAYRTLLATDIAHSAGRGDVAATEIRRVLRTALRESFTQSGITWDDCLVTDLGDGFSIAAPSDTSKIALLYPLLTELANRLRTHNRTAGDLTQIKVRAALHAGDITVDDTGVPTGRPLEVLARLLDAAPLRAALENTPEPTPVAAYLSHHFYEETVPHGHPGINTEDFHKYPFTTKEYSADAWLYLPGRPTSMHAPADHG